MLLGRAGPVAQVPGRAVDAGRLSRKRLCVMNTRTSATAIAEKLARDFLTRVWGPQHDVDAIDELMTNDYALHSGGKTIRGREAFKAWIVEFHRVIPEAVDEILDVFASTSGDRDCARWTNRVLCLPLPD